MQTGVTFQSAKSIVLGNSQPYQRLAQINPSDNGLVSFKLGSNPVFTGYVSNDFGGGWLLWLQYVHLGGTNPVLRTIAAHTNLPQLSPTALGGDDSANNTYWGAGSPAFLQAFPDLAADLEFRFYGITSGHARVIHFKTDSAMISRFRDNVGTMLDVNFQYTLLTGHTANLPRAANTSFNTQSLDQFPFYLGATYHWGIRGGGTRWEADDFPNNSANSTIHRVWVRYKPGNTFPLINNGDFNQGVTGWTLAGNVAISGGVAQFSGGDTPITGILSQVCQTEAGSQYNLRCTTSQAGGCAGGAARGTIEVRDNATNALITSQANATAATYNLPFTARGQILLRFVDTTPNTTSCDWRVDNISLSRYVQNG